MTEYGRWLGRENGDEMIRAVMGNGCSKKQAKDVITTYCMIFGIEVDTKEWDDLMRWAYDTYNCWFDSIDKFDMYMCRDLV